MRSGFSTRPSAWKMEKRCDDIRKGLLILIPVVLALFLIRTAGIDNVRAAAPAGGDVFIQIEGLIHGEMSSFHRVTLGMPVSINTESEEGLTAVPGIGPVLAESIVKARNEQGGFRALEDLKSVRGIGDKTYNKIIAYVSL